MDAKVCEIGVIVRRNYGTHIGDNITINAYNFENMWRFIFSNASFSVSRGEGVEYFFIA